MRAMAISEFGGPEVLQPAQLPDPVPGPMDLLVEVHAAGLNPLDFKVRKGAFGKGRQFPFVAGYDVSGVVAAAGERVQQEGRFAVGDAVYAMPNPMRDGANAEYVCVDARTASLKPTRLDHVEAAAMPLVTLTAWEALYERTQLAEGETILIQGGGGGVGHVAIQLAKLRGARVLTTASREESVTLCRQVGADLVINYAQENVVQRAQEETGGRGCPVVFDCVGFEVFDQSIQCVGVNGRMVSIVGTGSTSLLREMFVRSATLHFEFVGAPVVHNVQPERHGQILRQAAQLVEQGRLRVHVSHVFNLDQLADAHRLQETGHVTGKIVVRVR